MINLDYKWGVTMSGNDAKDKMNIVKEAAKNVGSGIADAGKTISSKAESIKKSAAEEINKSWFFVFCMIDLNDHMKADQILIKGRELGVEVGFSQTQGNRMMFVHDTEENLEKLMDALGDEYAYRKMNTTDVFLVKKSLVTIYKEKNDSEEDINSETNKNTNDANRKKKDKLDDILEASVTEYNTTYASFSDHGAKILNMRERSVDLLDNVENLINSVANHPKEFDAEFVDINVHKKHFKDICDYAKEELDAAQKSAMSAGAGIAGGMAVASLTPSAAMWVATTFGTASTGTAISSLSGAAAESAALAWIGGGTIAEGAGGMAAGKAFLAMAGPVGWSVAGFTLLTSIVLFAKKKRKLDKEKKAEIDSVKKNTEKLREIDNTLTDLLKKTDELRRGLSEQYTSAMSCYGKNFIGLSDEEQILLGTIVNNSKALSALLEMEVE